MVYSALVVSNNILRRAFESGADVTPMKLQKLVYLTASEYATATGTHLVADSFEAWEYGAASRVIFDKFVPFGGAGISKYAKDAMDVANMVDEAAQPEVHDAIERVWRLGQYLSPVELARLTRRTDSAWYKAWVAKTSIQFDDMVADITYRDRLGIDA